MFARFFKPKPEPKIIYENPIYIETKEQETVIIDDEPQWYTDEPNP